MQRVVLLLLIISLFVMSARTSGYIREEKVKQGGVDHHFRSMKHHLNMFKHHFNMSKIKKSIYPHHKLMKHHLNMMKSHHHKIKNVDPNMAQATESIMAATKNIIRV